MLIQILLFSGGVIFGTKSTQYLQNRQLVNDTLNKNQTSKQKVKSSSLYKKPKLACLQLKKSLKFP